MQVAFYAPLKAPTHPVPSGDRRMAQQLMRAFHFAGYEVQLASELRSLDLEGNKEKQAKIYDAAQREAELIINRYNAAEKSIRPTAWMTYHLYYKAPDWIGPVVSKALGVPYIISEASYAAKHADGPWASNQSGVEWALKNADAVITLTKRDIPGVKPLMNSNAEIFYLPPFLDNGCTQAIMQAGAVDFGSRQGLATRYGLDPNKRWLLSVAMMRPGAKLASYQWLAKSLNVIGGDDWQLLIVGDGSARSDVEMAFEKSCFKTKNNAIFYAGKVEDQCLEEIYGSADIFVWPAFNEAYGMVLLEAQAASLPLVVGNSGGVSDVIDSGRSSTVVDLDDPNEFGAAIRHLLDSPKLRKYMGDCGAQFIRQKRSVVSAAAVLQSAVGHASSYSKNW